jgi:hypothetical protein
VGVFAAKRIAPEWKSGPKRSTCQAWVVVVSPELQWLLRSRPSFFVFNRWALNCIGQDRGGEVECPTSLRL